MASRTDVAEPMSEIEEAFGGAAPLEKIGQAITIMESKAPVGAQKVAQMRDEQRILAKIKTYAAAAGEDFYYSWKVNNRKENRQDIVEGPSIKAALTVARLFGNCEVQVRVKDSDKGTHWIFYARFYDVETGYVLERAFQQRKSQNVGMGDGDRAQDIIFQIGQSKAIRNVICNALDTFTNFAMEQAKEAIVQKIGKNLPVYRDKLKARFAELGVDIKRPEAAIGLPVDKWLAQHMARLVSEIQSVNDGFSDPDETWPNPQGTIDSKRPDRADYNANGGTAGPANNAAPADTKPADETADWVEAQIAGADAAADVPKLDAIDDAVCRITDREKREDLRALWNAAYARNKERLAPKPEPKKQTPEEARVAEFQAWLADQDKALVACKTLAEVDALQDKVASELAGDEDLLNSWNGKCNSRAREIMGGRRR